MCFQRFYETWLEQLRHLIQQLRRAPKPPATQDENRRLLQLVHNVVTHHSEYCRVKSVAAESDVLAVFTARWTSALERSLHWIGGWHPTTVFHLIYSESSILSESHIVDILSGRRAAGDLGDLSPSQLSRVSELQCETVREENAITDELSEWQESASEVGRSMMREEEELEGRIQRLASVVEKAEDLRLRTIRGVVELLTPQQAAEFLIAAAELQIGVHEWGLHYDRQRGSD
ncbi:protein DOG1-like 4 [Malania oleifera]|uniref:protein DOG1-like 4 n=1 Tax=Malania oleifera TaxID=397392 RepID=UPI0025AE25C2|nr:protein DOG1-like 4 [Malania oleifera]